MFMKASPIVSLFLAVFLLFLIPLAGFAQVVTVAIVDTTFAFAMGGKVETSLGDFNDEATDLDVLFDSKITVCGKVGTADSTVKKFGIIRLNAIGTFDSTFGVNGKSVLNWGVSDYPNDMYLPGEGSIFAVGSTATVAGLATSQPSAYRLKSDGSADQSFGTDGHVLFSYDDQSHGEFISLFPEDTTLIACGSVVANSPGGANGFYAVRFRWNGMLDPNFGVAGKAFLPISVHSVNGFLSKSATITFTGVMDSNGQSYVILGRLTPSGQPDATFGVNGILNTGIILTAGTEIKSAIQQDFKVNCALPMLDASQNRPFTIVRFLSTGVVDSAYGTNGFVTVPIAPQAKCYGMNIANNGKTVINGSAFDGHEQSASARLDLVGLPDLSFNKTGMAVVDVDKGAYSNYLIRFVGMGLKRYMSIGGSIQQGKKMFLVARFKDDTVKTGGVTINSSHQDNFLYPNPATTSVTIESKATVVEIIDGMGRAVSLPIYSESAGEGMRRVADISGLANGIYYCLFKTGNERTVQKFLISR